jgi:hydroxyacylglutathione hydrolase
MLFERFEDKGLSQYSYSVGCKGAAEVAIVDPRRDIDVYLHYAAAQGVRIAYVLETHIHADFASGARELAERTGARLPLSALDRGELYEVKFPHEDLQDGQAIVIGTTRLVSRHTPGHTPEHMSFLVYDHARSASSPLMLLSGDFLFVGSLGRPDLLGEDAKRALAERLFESVRRLPDLPDGLEVHPGHGSGSMCGSGMSDRPMTTLGFERVANPYLKRGLDRAAFVAHILGNVPPFPPYYRRMKTVNSSGLPSLNGLPGLKALGVGEFRSRVDRGHVVIDLRDQLSFGGGHIPRAFGIGAGQDLSTWASWVVPYDTPILLVDAANGAAGDAARIEQAVRSLVRVGLDQVEGYLAGGMEAWGAAGLPQTHTPQLTPAELHARLKAGERIRVIDVRSISEWERGHIDGARNIMGGFLADRAAELKDSNEPIAVTCAAGYRSTVAASVLERAGIGPVYNVIGGMGAWTRAGLPTVT